MSSRSGLGGVRPETGADTDAAPTPADSPGVVAIVGPTAVGKSSLAVRLARRLDGEIISADSVQVYRGLDIGSAKPSPQERAETPHHLIDIVDPPAGYSAGDFVRDADTAIAEIELRGRVPLVCGGTGLYVRSLIEGLAPRAARDDGVRAQLESRLDAAGSHAMHEELNAVDPDYAEQIHPNDAVRIIRGLEVFELTGRPLSEHHAEHDDRAPRYRALCLGLVRPRAELHGRIGRRARRMVEDGLVDEVQGLLDAGVPADSFALGTLGYRHATAFLDGTLDRGELIPRLARDTRRYARRQLTWFRRQLEVRWFTAAALEDAVARSELATAIERWRAGSAFELGHPSDGDALAAVRGGSA